MFRFFLFNPTSPSPLRQSSTPVLAPCAPWNVWFPPPYLLTIFGFADSCRPSLCFPREGDVQSKIITILCPEVPSDWAFFRVLHFELRGLGYPPPARACTTNSLFFSAAGAVSAVFCWRFSRVLIWESSVFFPKNAKRSPRSEPFFTEGLLPASLLSYKKFTADAIADPSPMVGNLSFPDRFSSFHVRSHAHDDQSFCLLPPPPFAYGLFFFATRPWTLFSAPGSTFLLEKLQRFPGLRFLWAFAA